LAPGLAACSGLDAGLHEHETGLIALLLLEASPDAGPRLPQAAFSLLKYGSCGRTRIRIDEQVDGRQQHAFARVSALGTLDIRVSILEIETSVI
jgi:hypothetical protein